MIFELLWISQQCDLSPLRTVHYQSTHRDVINVDVSNSPLYVLRVSHVVPLCVFIPVEQHGHSRYKIQHLSCWKDPQIPLGVRASIPVTAGCGQLRNVPGVAVVLTEHGLPVWPIHINGTKPDIPNPPSHKLHRFLLCYDLIRYCY